jgi:Glycosyl transferase family group 2
VLSILPWLLLTAYFRPLVEIVLLILGEWWFHTRFEEDRTKFNRYIIQITTVGREVERVKEIIDEIKSYPMSMDYQIWVVLEPGNPVDYPHADRVIVVPKEFVAVSQYKCRALEYTRTVRAKLGYGGYDTKITFLDDDTSPTWEYLETAYAGDYDICQGLTAPRVEYGSGPFTHYLLSHIDDLRFHNCMTYCSSFQGIFNSPLFVHGEGLTITGSTEQQVGWNFRIFASEDLTFGCNAANQGLRWGWFHEYIELTSPWTWGAYFKQRRRWMWGNIHAIVNRDVLPFWPAVRVATRYVLSLFTFIGSAVAILLIHYDKIHISEIWFQVFWCSLGIWVLNFMMSGWVNAGRRVDGQSSLDFWANRVFQTLSAVILAPFSAAFTVIALITTLYMGNPKAFEVIGKTAKTSDTEVYTADDTADTAAQAVA